MSVPTLGELIGWDRVRALAAERKEARRRIAARRQRARSGGAAALFSPPDNTQEQAMSEYDGHTYSVGHVHTLAEVGGPCRDDCPHPDHAKADNESADR